MLKAIVRFSLRFRGIEIALAFALLGYGIYSLAQARYDVFPEFAPPQVSIQTEAPGLAPEQVEVLVTQPIENAINGVAGIAQRREDVFSLEFPARCGIKTRHNWQSIAYCLLIGIKAERGLLCGL